MALATRLDNTVEGPPGVGSISSSRWLAWRISYAQARNRAPGSGRGKGDRAAPQVISLMPANTAAPAAICPVADLVPASALDPFTVSASRVTIARSRADAATVALTSDVGRGEATIAPPAISREGAQADAPSSGSAPGSSTTPRERRVSVSHLAPLGPATQQLAPLAPERRGAAQLPAGSQPPPMALRPISVSERAFLAADSLHERLGRILPIDRNGGQYGALLLIDRDIANNTTTRDVIIERLAGLKRQEDWLGWSADGHFALILTQLGFRDEWAARRAAQFALRLVRGPLGRERFGSGAAIGATLLAPIRVAGPSADPGADTDSRLVSDAVTAAQNEALAALRGARAVADGEVRFFNPNIDAMLRALGTMDRDLRNAVEQNRFVVQFQTIVNAAGQLERAEALARWRHSSGTLISADRFFERAETLGLAVPIGYQVIETVIRQLAFWSREPELAKIPIAINLSASQLADPYLVEYLKRLLQGLAVAPERVVIELAESVLALASDDAVRRLKTLSQLGCPLAIDGFGRGWLTWSRIRELPLRELKLPIASPAGIGQAARLAGFARQLGLNVTATRIETLQQWRDAIGAQFQAFQGNVIGRPAASTSALLAQLRERNGCSGSAAVKPTVLPPRQQLSAQNVAALH